MYLTGPSHFLLSRCLPKDRLQRLPGTTAGINAALLLLGDFRRVPGDGLRPDGNRRWQYACLHFPPDGGARPAGCLVHRRQAEKFSHGVHEHSLDVEQQMAKGRCADCVVSPRQFDVL